MSFGYRPCPRPRTHLISPTLNMQAQKASDSPRRQKERDGGRSSDRLHSKAGLRESRPLRRNVNQHYASKRNIQGNLLLASVVPSLILVSLVCHSRKESAFGCHLRHTITIPKAPVMARSKRQGRDPYQPRQVRKKRQKLKARHIAINYVWLHNKDTEYSAMITSSWTWLLYSGAKMLCMTILKLTV